ncbi:coilin [Leptodactylus fuscus]|uniref:coilin n=1 Tax=Leptodactylus fuscus TaxID=238119 RepID=UPI003F4F28C7
MAAAPGSGGEIRVKLMFDYPPPVVPQSRQLWFMLDTGLCRAVTDVSAIIQERFYYSRRGALSLYLDGCLLPPGESVRLIRDNDAISVKWEESGGPHDSPPWGPRKKVAEEDCGDFRNNIKEVHTEATEKSKKKRDKRNRPLEEEVVNEGPKRKKKDVTPESEEHEVSQRPKKKKKKEKKKEVTSEEEASEQPRRRVTLKEDEVSKRSKKKGVTPMDEVKERPKKGKLRDPQRVSEQSAKASEQSPKNNKISKDPGTKKPQLQKEAPPPLSSSRKETSSSSSSDQEDTERSRREEPGPPTRMQQRDGSSSPDTLIIKKPLTAGLSPPVYNGRVARGGAQHRSPLKSAGRGVSRGRGIPNLPWRGRGFRGQGEAQLQNNFFYNYSPETLKEQHLNEDVSNVSVLIQNPPELPKKDYSALPLLAAPPQPGKIIAFKLLELTENYTPEVSDYKEGQILSYDPVTQQVEVEVLSQPKKKEPGKFDLIYEGEDGTDIVEYAVPQECKISQAWSSLIEPRLVTEHGPQLHVAAGL